MVERGTALLRKIEINVSEAEKRTGKNAVNMQETYTVYLIETRSVVFLFSYISFHFIEQIFNHIALKMSRHLVPHLFCLKGRRTLSPREEQQLYLTCCGDATVSSSCSGLIF